MITNRQEMERDRKKQDHKQTRDGKRYKETGSHIDNDSTDLQTPKK